MSRILIIGATNPIGEQLIRDCLADPAISHILAVGRDDTTDTLTIDNHPKLTYIALDLTSPESVQSLLFGAALDIGVEVIIHLATTRDPYKGGERVHAQNVDLLRTLLNLSGRHPTIKRLVLRSFSEVYSVSVRLPTLIREEHPLNLAASAPQYIRDRVEADLAATSMMGVADLDIVVLRCAEALGPGTGSQLYDYLNATVSLRPAGFDPMLNVATIKDLAKALHQAAHSEATGVFNIPGYDTLPLSLCIKKWGTPGLALPETLIRPLYKLRHALSGSKFRYGLNRKRMHYGVVLDGSRASEHLGYTPNHPVSWPTP